MNPDRSIRAATKADISYLRRFQSLAVYRDAGYCPPGALEIRADRGQILMVELNGQHAGYLNFTHRKDGITHISQVAIDYELWRDGHGDAIVTRLCAAAAAAGSRVVTCKVVTTSPANLFWKAMGFIHTADVCGRRRILHAYSRPTCVGGVPEMPPMSNWGKANASLLFNPNARRPPKCQSQSPPVPL